MFDNVDWGIVCFQMMLALISSGIVGALLNNHWNKKAAEKNKAFEKEVSGLKAKLDSGTYVTNIQYEREFNILQELWNEYVNYLLDYRKIEHEVVRGIFKADNFVNAEKSYDDLISYFFKIYPFINENVLAVLEELWNAHSDYLDLKSCKETEKFNKARISINIAENKAQKAIYNYLNSLKVK